MTKHEAIAKAATKWWEGLSAREIVTFQLYESLLCMPFPLYHAATEEALGRPVWTHEFGLNIHGLRAEFEGKRGPATIDEVLLQIPEDKRVIVI